MMTSSNGPRVADLFAGGGGFSVGAKQAGCRPVFAANHNPQAIDFHARNHPDITHVCQDLRQYDFATMPEYDGLLASPCCQGHSQASQPKRNKRHDDQRATAYAVIDCVSVTQPKFFIVENVIDIKRWGPNDDGTAYAHWLAGLKLWGYDVAEYTLQGADFGCPSERERLFVVGVRQGSAAGLTFRQRPQRASRTILEDIPKSHTGIGGWKPIADKSAAIKARVARGRKNHGRTFLTQHVTDHNGRSLDEPMATITCQDGHWHLVDGGVMRPLSVRELARGMTFRDDYVLPKQQKLGTLLIGNAVQPDVAEIVTNAVVDRVHCTVSPSVEIAA